MPEMWGEKSPEVLSLSHFRPFSFLKLFVREGGGVGEKIEREYRAH